MERFRQEARAGSALNHPNICTIHETSHQDGHCFKVMELLEGKRSESALSTHRSQSINFSNWQRVSPPASTPPARAVSSTAT
jgi:serine/threonine protein kinase